MPSSSVLAAAAFVAVFAGVVPAEALTFRRSFRNGYPMEWNVSKEEAREGFHVSDRGVRFSDGRGGTVQTQTADEFFGAVSSVEPGGVILVRDARGGAMRRVALSGVDVPVGDAPQERLRELVEGKTVNVHVGGKRRGGGLVGKVTTGGAFEEVVDVGLALVRDGYATRARGNADPRYGAAQKEAREAGRGLWAKQARRK